MMLPKTIAAALLASTLFAQDHLYLTGYSDSGGPLGPSGNSYPIGRFKDIDRNGTIDDTSELFPFLTTSFNTRNGTGSFIADIAWTQEGDNYAFYVADSADGRITRGVDRDGNGRLDPSEVTEFYDFMTGFAPDGIAVRRDVNASQTIVYVAIDDQPNNPGIHRLVDLDNDGTATGPGEHTVFVSSASGLSVPSGGGTVALASDWWVALHVLPSGKLIAYNGGPSKISGGGGGAQAPDMFCWYAFTDANGTPSVSVFFDPSQINGIDTHPDFAPGGKFPNFDVVLSSATLHPTWSDVRFFAADLTNAPQAPTYYLSSSYRDSTTSGYSGNNLQGQLVSGLIYRWLDVNANDTVDANEISLFGNISNNTYAGVAPFTYNEISGAGTVLTLTDAIFGLEATDGNVHLCWDSKGKSVVTMRDQNGNGVIETGEAVHAYKWSGAQHPTEPVYHQSFGPYVKGYSSFPRGFMPGPFRVMTPYDAGCPLPTTGLTPQADSFGGEPKVGNAGFEIAVVRALPASPAFLLIGTAKAKLDLTVLGLPKCFALTNGFATVGPTIADGDGVAGVNLPIPNHPNLVGFKLYFQWGCVDPAAGGIGVYFSNGLEVPIQP